MGIEPTTPCLQSRCSSQLSYVPEGMSLKRDWYTIPPAQRVRSSTLAVNPLTSNIHADAAIQPEGIRILGFDAEADHARLLAAQSMARLEQNGPTEPQATGRPRNTEL